jgi:hypothetical protein
METLIFLSGGRCSSVHYFEKYSPYYVHVLWLVAIKFNISVSKEEIMRCCLSLVVLLG